MATPAADRWSRVIDHQESTGMTIRAFASKHGINPSTLAWWRSHLGRGRKRKKSSNRTTFIEVIESVEPKPAPARLILHVRKLGVHVEVETGTDLRHLRQVLEALC